jgi:hypothetical protein
MVALENTHNHQGGTILPQDEIVRVREVCDEFGLVYHLDGARIWNVHVATGMSLPELTRPFHSFTCCLSKGLGAPVGSMVVGSADLIARGRRRRKILGGGMRQAGILAAAGLYAVKNNIPRLAEDHANAAFLTEKLARVAAFRIDRSRVQTNIILVDLVNGQTGEQVLGRLKEVGVLAVQFGPRTLRFVTHLTPPAKEVAGGCRRYEAMSGNSFTILGSSSGLPQAGRACSGYLLQTGESLSLIDCGGGVTSSFLRSGFDPLKLDRIFISHTHSDHCCELSLVIQMLHVLKSTRRLDIFIPDEFVRPFLAYLNAVYLFPQHVAPALNIQGYADGFVYRGPGFELTALANQHLARPK